MARTFRQSWWRDLCTLSAPWERIADGRYSDTKIRQEIRSTTVSQERRAVKDMLKKGREPEPIRTARWSYGIPKVRGVAYFKDQTSDRPWDNSSPVGIDIENDDPICPPNTMCGCGEALATIAIRFSPDDTRFYCYPCS